MAPTASADDGSNACVPALLAHARPCAYRWRLRLWCLSRPCCAEMRWRPRPRPRRLRAAPPSAGVRTPISDLPVLHRRHHEVHSVRMQVRTSIKHVRCTVRTRACGARRGRRDGVRLGGRGRVLRERAPPRAQRRGACHCHRVRVHQGQHQRVCTYVRTVCSPNHRPYLRSNAYVTQIPTHGFQPQLPGKKEKDRASASEAAAGRALYA